MDAAIKLGLVIVYVIACVKALATLKKTKKTLLEAGLESHCFTGMQASLVAFIGPAMLFLFPLYLLWPILVLHPLFLSLIYLIGMWIGWKIRKNVPVRYDYEEAAIRNIETAIALGAVGLLLQIVPVLLGLIILGISQGTAP